MHLIDLCQLNAYQDNYRMRRLTFFHWKSLWSFAPSDLPDLALLAALFYRIWRRVSELPVLMCYHLGQDALVDLDLDQSSMQVDGSTPHACARPRVDENLPAHAQ